MLKDLFESSLNTSTESIESGFFDFDLDFETATKMNIGDAIEGILTAAQVENRIICGLSDASRHLKESDSSENSLFFFIAPSPLVDSLTHMTEVFLQAFCFENDIYIVKLDCAQKLSRILNSETLVTCALTQKATQSLEMRREKYTDLEKVLIDHCENFWDEPVQPIIRLPEKWTEIPQKMMKQRIADVDLFRGHWLAQQLKNYFRCSWWLTCTDWAVTKIK